MPQLEDITDLPPDAVELLEAVGYLDAQDLKEAEPKELVAELVKANKALSIMLENPSETNVREWQELASAHVHEVFEQDTEPKEAAVEEIEEHESDQPDQPDQPDEVDQDEASAEHQSDDDSEAEDETHAFDIDPNLVNFEEDPEVQEMLSISPEAVPLHPSLIRRHKLAVADIPEGMLLSQCAGEVEINVMTTARLANAQRREAEIKRTGLMVSRIRNFDDAESGDHHIKPLEKRENEGIRFRQ